MKYDTLKSELRQRDKKLSLLWYFACHYIGPGSLCSKIVGYKLEILNPPHTYLYGIFTYAVTKLLLYT